MPYIEPRINAHGKITSYRIVISDGYTDNGEQIRHRFIWTPPRPDMSPQVMEREATVAAYKYQEEVRNGFRLDNSIAFCDYANHVLNLKEQAGVRPTTLDRYIEMLPRINEAIGTMQLVKIRPEHLDR